MKPVYLRALISAGCFLFLTHCGVSGTDSDDSSESATENATTVEGLPAIYSKFSSDVTIHLDGDQVVLETYDIPNHPSPYFNEDEELYEEPDDDMVVNPNRIQEQNYMFRVPLSPQLASLNSETNLDAIGIAANGVVFFNQYAGRTTSGDWLPLDNELPTLDRFNGHPAQQGNYHYHLEPLFLTESDPTAFLGVMLDGFPIYGPQDQDGNVPTDLDECNGHSEATADYPDGIYHYHATEEEPYLIGCYRGEPGTVSN